MQWQLVWLPLTYLLLWTFLATGSHLTGFEVELIKRSTQKNRFHQMRILLWNTAEICRCFFRLGGRDLAGWLACPPKARSLYLFSQFPTLVCFKCYKRSWNGDSEMVNKNLYCQSTFKVELALPITILNSNKKNAPFCNVFEFSMSTVRESHRH